MNYDIPICCTITTTFTVWLQNVHLCFVKELHLAQDENVLLAIASQLCKSTCCKKNNQQTTKKHSAWWWHFSSQLTAIRELVWCSGTDQKSGSLGREFASPTATNMFVSFGKIVGLNCFVDLSDIIASCKKNSSLSTIQWYEYALDNVLKSLKGNWRILL